MASDQEQFEILIQNLLSSDNKIRVEAEESYEGVQAIVKVPFLFQTMIKQSCSLSIRSMASVMLRRLFTSSFDEFWPQFPIETQNELKNQMMNIIQQETEDQIRKKICECVAEFARSLIDEEGNNKWPEFLNFLFACIQSGNVQMKKSALIIFSIVPGIYGKEQTKLLDHIKQMFLLCFNDSDSEVRNLSAKAAVSFILSNDLETSTLNSMKELLQPILKCVAESVEKEDDDTLLKNLIDLADLAPKYIKFQLDLFFNLCLKIVDNKALSDQLRQLALEALVTFTESTPAAVKKHPKIIESLVSQSLQMMVDLEEDEEWVFSDKAEDNDSDSNPVAGESALDRMACALGGKTMLLHITTNIPIMLQNGDWKFRHAGLMAISACGEGCHSQMEGVLEKIVQAILPFLNDQHPRVRYASCNALGQMSSDFSPLFQKKFHKVVVPGLLSVIQNNYNFPRVQAHAGAALVNFSEDSPKSILINYLDPIMTQLEQVLNAKFEELLTRGTKLVLEQIVTTLASVADTAEEKFEIYYDRFMPKLKYIFQNSTNDELKTLRGKTIECISLIGLAVGKEKFIKDCSELMELLLKTQSNFKDLPDDDPQISYMISAWARICKIMGRDFEKYLPHVMGPVLKAASLKPEVAVFDTDDMKTLEDDADWHFVTLGDQTNFGIRTSGLEEKVTAFQMLVCYARELKEGFVEYAEEVVKIMVYHLKFYFHDGVRVAAAESLPFLLECARIKGPEYVGSMWSYICPELLSAVESDPELTVKAEHLNSLAQCIQFMGIRCFSEEQMKQVVQLLNKLLSDHFKRQETRQIQKTSDEDYDEETEMNEENDYIFILSKVSDVIHSLFSTHKLEFLPFFQELTTFFVRLVNSDKDWSDKQWGLCIFDDLLEFAGPSAQYYTQHFLQPLMQSINHPQPEVRQAATYGIGVMAQSGGMVFAATCAEAVPLLSRVVHDPDSRSPENANATENAISAMGKICRYNNSNINLPEVLSLWFSWLPVTEDEEEAGHIYDYVCELVGQNNPVILGENNNNLPKILNLFVQSFHLNLIQPSSSTGQKMVSIIRHLQANQQVFQACVSQLSPEFQKTLAQSLT